MPGRKKERRYAEHGHQDRTGMKRLSQKSKGNDAVRCNSGVTDKETSSLLKRENLIKKEGQ